MVAVGQMAGGVAHDLNNVLSGLVSYPELLLLQLPEDSPLRKSISVIHESGMRAASSVADLLTLSRDVTKTSSMNSLNSLVLEALQSPEWLQLKKNYPQLKVDTDLTSAVTDILCSPTHIAKCIANLIAFSADTVAGDGQLTIKTEVAEHGGDQDIPPALSAGRYLVLSLTDNGPGLEEEHLPHLFEPFYVRKQMGRNESGIGLTLIDYTMIDHAGAVQVDSQPGRTCFRLFFPLA